MTKARGYGRTFTDGVSVGRYYDPICGGWVRVNGRALISNGRKMKNHNQEKNND